MADINVTIYSSFKEMMGALENAMRDADQRVNPTQASIKPGQYFINFRHGPELPIYGKVLECDSPTYNEEHMRHYRLTECYSVACPFGEIGDTHVSCMDAVIDEMLFEYYRENGWVKPETEF